MVGHGVAQPLDPELKLVRTVELEGAVAPDALVVHSDGRLSFRGATVASVGAFLSARGAAAESTVRVVPDRDLPAAMLVEIGAALNAGGVDRVMVVTERGLE